MSAVSLARTTMSDLGGQGEDRCQPQRILVVDEHELIQVGLRSVLTEQAWVSACLGASTVNVAWQLARRHHPQIALVSDSLPGTPGLELCRQFRARLPLIKVVLMSGSRPVPVRLATASGAVGSLPKELPTASLISAVRRVADGAQVFRREPAWPGGELSARELEVIQHLVAGLSNPEMAVVMHLSTWTVKQHTSCIYRKLGVRNRAQAVTRALDLGLAEGSRNG